MADIDQINSQFHDIKINHLKSLWKQAKQTVEKLNNNILHLEEKWMSDLGEKQSIYEFMPAIDKVVEFVNLACKDISEIDKNIVDQMTEEISINISSIQNLIQKRDEDEKYMNFISELMKQNDRYEKKFAENEEILEIVNARLNKIDKCESKIKKIQKQMNNLSENVNQVQDIISKNDKNVNDKFIDFNKEIEELKDFVTTAIVKSNSEIFKLNKQRDSQDSFVKDLLENMNKDKESIKKIETNIDQLRFNVEEVTEKLKVVEEITEKLKVVEEREEKRDLQKQFEGVNTKYEIVCQILASRIKPLEQLQQTLNEKSKSRDDNVSKLQELIKEVAVLSPKIDQLA